MLDAGFDVGIEVVEGSAGARDINRRARKNGGETRSEETAVEASKEQGDTKAELSDAVGEAVWQPLGDAVGRKLVGNGTLADVASKMRPRRASWR